MIPVSDFMIGHHTLLFLLILFTLFATGTSSQHGLITSSSSHSMITTLGAVPFTEHDITTSAASACTLCVCN